MEKKTLVLIRHAKSSWSDEGLDDFDRGLNKRGKRDAPFMGDQLRKRNIIPDLFLSSSAKRARKTTKHIAAAINYPVESVIFLPELYLADERELLEVINTTDESVGTLVLVAHNYGITDLAVMLSGENIANIPTCGVVGLTFNNKWEKLEKGKALLAFFDYPKKFERD